MSGSTSEPDERPAALPEVPTAEEAARSRLFSPLRLTSRCTLEARTWVPAMVPWRATDDGQVTDDLLAWYGRFADGQPAALVVEATGVRDVPSGPLLRIGDDRFVAGLRGLVEAVRARSAGHTRVFVQLIDFLAIKRRPDPRRYFAEFLQLADRHRRALAALERAPWPLGAPEIDVRRRLCELEDAQLPSVLSPRELSDVRFGVRERVTDTHEPHIRDLPAALPSVFAAAARRARDAGFDGVELHAAHAYTLASFLSALNTRDDGYGGTREGRARLPREVLRAVRDAVGGDLVVGVRLLADEAIPDFGGHGVDDAAYFATELARAGADFVSLSRGGKFEDARLPAVGHAAYPYTGPSGEACMPTLRVHGEAARGLNLPLARRVRTALRAAGFATPVVAAGGLQSFPLAEGALRRGDCDLVAAARQSLADPDWWLKLRLGRGAEIRRCTLTNYCEGLDQKHKKVTCRLWDRLPPKGDEPTGREGQRRLVAPRWER